MSEWWLFRNTRIENVNEQHEIARKHLPDTTHWLGSEHNTTTSTLNVVT